MKYLVYIFPLIAILISPLCCKASDTVWLTNTERPPFMSQELAHNGLISHIVTEAFARAGIRVEYTFFPGPEAYEQVRSGEMEGGIIYSKTPEREESVLFSSETVWEGRWIFYHLKSFQFHWETFNDFRGIEIGAALGSDYGRRFKNALRKGKLSVQWALNDERNFFKLLDETVQVMIHDPQVAMYQMNKLLSNGEIDRITWHPQPFYKTRFHLIMSRKYMRSRHLIRLFDQGMRQIRENGRFDRMVLDFQNGRYER